MNISIIIPVYNAGNYLNSCIDSILKCGGEDFEIILINDGSTDNSEAVCDQYALKYSCVSVFHQSNSGVSAARNLGIQHASGDYITFVDADDFVASDYLMNIRLALVNEVDICIFNYTRWVNEQLHEVGRQILPEGKYTDKKCIYEQALELEISMMSVWCQVYRTLLVKNNRIAFRVDMQANEDFAFVLDCLDAATSVYFSGGHSYNYRYNFKSVTGKRPLSHAEDYSTTQRRLMDIAKKHNISDIVMGDFYRKWLRWNIDLVANWKRQKIPNSQIKQALSRTGIVQSAFLAQGNAKVKLEKYLLLHNHFTYIRAYMGILGGMKQKLKRVRL